MADVLGKVEQSLPERVAAHLLCWPRQSQETEPSLLQWWFLHCVGSVLSRDLCGVLSLRNLPPWVLQERVCGFGVYTLQLIMQMCGQCSLLFPGAVLKLFKAMGIDLSLEKKHSGELSQGLSLWLRIYAFKKQLPSNWRDVMTCGIQHQMNRLCFPGLKPRVRWRWPWFNSFWKKSGSFLKRTV